MDELCLRTLNRIQARFESLIDKDNKLVCLMIETYDWYPLCVVDNTDKEKTYLGDYLLGQPCRHDELFHHVPNANQVAIPKLMLQLEDTIALPFLRHTNLMRWGGVEPREPGPPFIRNRHFWILGDHEFAWNHVLPLWYELGRTVRLLSSTWQEWLSLHHVRGHNDASVWLHTLFTIGLSNTTGWPLSIGTGVNTTTTQSGINREASQPTVSDWCFSQVRDVIDASVAAVDVLTTKAPPITSNTLDVNSVEANLQHIGVGRSGQVEFPQYIAEVLKQLFFPELTNPVTEQRQNDGRSRIDITFDNQANSGFFYDLVFRHEIKCPYILFECKNYTEDLENPEFAQLVDRFSDSIGFVGFIVCRHVSDKNNMNQHCKDRYGKKRHVILVLDDVDIIGLVRAKASHGEAGVSKLLGAKLGVPVVDGPKTTLSLKAPL